MPTTPLVGDRRGAGERRRGREGEPSLACRRAGHTRARSLSTLAIISRHAGLDGSDNVGVLGENALVQLGVDEHLVHSHLEGGGPPRGNLDFGPSEFLLEHFFERFGSREVPSGTAVLDRNGVGRHAWGRL
jgi:hypothetical protein